MMGYRFCFQLRQILTHFFIVTGAGGVKRPYNSTIALISAKRNDINGIRVINDRGVTFVSDMGESASINQSIDQSTD